MNVHNFLDLKDTHRHILVLCIQKVTNVQYSRVCFNKCVLNFNPIGHNPRN